MNRLSASINPTFTATRDWSSDVFLSLALLATLLLCATSNAGGQSNYEPYTFGTYSGQPGVPGSADGARSFARFRGSDGVAVDSRGNVYIADTFNNTIRKMTAAGVVSTFAGLAGIGDAVDGPGSTARFSAPRGVGVDKADNIYVADTGNYTIRKITPAGVVSTLAGLAGSHGSDDGTGSAARFDNPSGVAVDDSGNIYVADTGNHTIRKVTPSGVVTTVAGLAGNHGPNDGTGAAARFNRPHGVAVDHSGNIYVADNQNHTVRKVTPGGVVTTIAGLAGSPGSDDGTGSAARFENPHGVAVRDAGNIYVADTANNTIRKITSGGVVTTLAGFPGQRGGTDGSGESALFYSPQGIAYAESGEIYVSESGNNTIRRVSLGGTVSTVGGSAGFAGDNDGMGSAAQFRGPTDAALDGAGNLYVADRVNHTIRKITSDRVVTTLAGVAGDFGAVDGTGSDARFNTPSGLAINTAGTIYVADYNNHTIRKITPGGVVTTLAGFAGVPGSNDGTGSAARFNYPDDVAVDAGGNIFVADSGNHVIRRITPAGVVSTVAGLAGVSGSANGTGSAARFAFPGGVAVDTQGNAFVADSANNTIRKITSAGVVTTLAGLAGQSGSADGTGSNARFYGPQGVTVDSAGNVYIGDLANSTLRKINPAGVVTTFAGVPFDSGSADGIGSSARFNGPAGLTSDNDDNIYVADASNSTIRRVTPSAAVTTIAGVAGKFGSGDGQCGFASFYRPYGAAVDRTGNVYVADSWNHTIRKITPNGLTSTLAGLAGVAGSSDGAGSAARFNYPHGVALDSAGNLFVVEQLNHTIRKITPAGVVTTFAGLAGNPGSVNGAGSSARFSAPQGIAVDGAGNLYVADSGNQTIRKITPAAVVSTLAGLPGTAGSNDGSGSAARFYYPNGVAVDTAHNVYVADTSNSTIRKITPAGVVTTLAGVAGLTGSMDGTGSGARFSNPNGVAVDSVANVYVADSNNNLIRKITPAGVVKTLAGYAGGVGVADGSGGGALFNYPTGLAVDGAQNLYVCDYANGTIRFGSPPMALFDAFSRQSHAGATRGAAVLPNAVQETECRSNSTSPGLYQIVLNFAATNALTVTSASATPDPAASPAATGTVNSYSTNGSEVTITLTGVSNAQTMLVNLGVTDGVYKTNVSLPISFLQGDTNGDGTVNSADIGLAKSKSGQSVGATNFREDLNVDGSINSADISLVKSKSGTALP